MSKIYAGYTYTKMDATDLEAVDSVLYDLRGKCVDVLNRNSKPLSSVQIAAKLTKGRSLDEVDQAIVENSVCKALYALGKEGHVARTGTSRNYKYRPGSIAYTATRAPHTRTPHTRPGAMKKTTVQARPTTKTTSKVATTKPKTVGKINKQAIKNVLSDVNSIKRKDLTWKDKKNMLEAAKVLINKAT